ncbi:MAG: hypothetical protein HWE23_09435 [Rhodobacteraceae bacterium]|nr:hypothetical protein [Paracoccaceae bacterium]
MFRTLVIAFKLRPYLFLAFFAMFGLTLFFGIRFTLSTIYWSDPAHIDQPIEGWMTPRYVARSWKLPREVIGQALDLPQGGGRPAVTLEELAEQRGQSLDELIGELTQAVEAYRSQAND